LPRAKKRFLDDITRIRGIPRLGIRHRQRDTLESLNQLSECVGIVQTGPGNQFFDRQLQAISSRRVALGIKTRLTHLN
jgi:hypothetical protein